MNIKKELIDELLHEKIEKDWREYYDVELLRTKEELFRKSYMNAIAGEWRYFFADIFGEGYVENCEEKNSLEVTIKMLLSLQNIFVELVKDSCEYNSIDINPENFKVMFEGFVERKCGIRMGSM